MEDGAWDFTARDKKISEMLDDLFRPPEAVPTAKTEKKKTELV